nr:G-type lectin S-receptor-like serine/threonine-protein kinase LECRK3 [Ziziphus jujuba var. spinosa]
MRRNMYSLRTQDRIQKRISCQGQKAEGRINTLARQPIVVGKDKDMLRDSGEGSDLVEEKIRRLPTGGESWDKKMKRKRSVGTVLSRPMDDGVNNNLWLSPSKDFAFGFHQLDNDAYILAIWYYKLSGQLTTVWYAIEGKPARRNSKLELTSDSALVLKNDAQTLRNSGKTGSAEVGYDVMNDTGNFILLHTSSKPIWESFNHPTDTLMPSQIMKLGGFLYARTSNNDLTPRRFLFRLDIDGIAKLITIILHGNQSYHTYYSAGDTSNPGSFVFNPFEFRCWKKRSPLSNGRVELYTTAYIKTAYNSSPDIPLLPPKVPAKDQNILMIVLLSVLLGSSVMVNFVFVGATCMGFLMFLKRNLLGPEISPNESSIENRLQQFTYKELIEATNGFKEELGRGSCGILYKGETRSTGLIAVKMLDRVFEDIDREFKVEVNIIGQTHHKNLVRLVGYCDEKQHRLLVYEFLRNGTLAKFLYVDPKPSWKQRTEIAFGIARGLAYLHDECTKQIIHCDIKPQNILLDEYYNARISDFGLAKLLLINQSHTKTNIRGTKGYVAPDWFRSAPVSVKVDVYSFGVVLLEIICCRRNVLDREADEEHKIILTDYAFDCYLEGKLDALIENDMEAMDDMKMVERFVMVAIWCLQEDPNIRPTMKKVLLMLEGVLQVSTPPAPFSFTSVKIEH